jgi:putative phosphoesterase
MRILVVSDTHGHAEQLKFVRKKTGAIDILIHAGDIEGQEDYIRKLFDCPLFMVAGNNDWGSGLKRELTFQIDDFRIFLTHGNRYGVSLGTERLLAEAEARRVDICVFGHTHRPTLFKKNNITMMNPGSIAYPRQIGRKPTYGLIDIDENHMAEFSIGQIG